MRNMFSVLMLAVTLSVVACDRLPNDPSLVPDPTPPYDQSKYEVLPTERHYLIDPNTGQATKMWARLISVSPARGSGITLGPDACPARCFRYSMELGFEAVENPNVVAKFRVGFSHDRETISVEFIGGYAVKTGSSVMVGENTISRFDEVPEYFLVEGSHWDNAAPNQKRSGKTTFDLDYHLR